MFGRFVRQSTVLARGVGVRLLSQDILKSPFELKLDPKLTSMSFPKFITYDFLKKEKADKICTIDGVANTKLTFRETFVCSYQIANALRRQGMKAGSTVAIFSPNDLHYVTTFLGIGLTGACATPINPTYTEEEVSFQVEKTKASLMIAHPATMERALVVAKKFGIPVITLGTEKPKDVLGTIHDVFKREKFEDIDVNSFLGSGSDGFDSDSLLTVPFSSGTTGVPKGVMLSHKNVISNTLQAMPIEGDMMKDQKLLCPLPYFHIYGLIVAIMAMRAGGTMIFMPAFDLVRYLELAQQHKVTRTYIVPPIIIALAKHPVVSNYDLSNLKHILSGAAPLGGDIQALCAKRLKVMIKQGWGMTELSPIAAIMPDFAVKSDEAVKGCAGILAPATEARIVDHVTGEDKPFTEAGEVLIRGPQVMRGYLNNPEATKQTITPDGWLHTGDIGHFTKEGWLYITDRCKELIKYKGFQVAPAELEALLLSMPGVKDCVVIPVLDEEAGELPRAYVVRQDNVKPEELTEHHVQEFVNKHVAPHKRLRGGVRFTDVVPKSPSGKILRRVQIAIDRKSPK